MAKQKTHIDDLFKKGLGSLEQPLNGTEWNRLHAAMHPKKKRFLWWLLIPALLVMGGFGWWLTQNGSSTVETGFIANENEAFKSPSPDSDTELTDVSDVTEPILSMRDSNPKLANASKSKELSQKSVKPVVSQKANQFAHAKRFVQPSRLNIAKGPTDPLETLSDTNKRFNNFDILNLFPRKLHQIGKGLQVLIPSILQAVSHPRLHIEKATNALPKAYVGFTASGLRFSQNVSGSTPEYSRLRNHNELPTIKLSYGFEAGTTWKGFDFGSGLSYLEKGQQYGGQFKLQLFDLLPYIDLNGDTTFIPWNHRDTIIATPNTPPTYSYLSIPIQLGKSFNIGQNYKLEIGLQGQVNLLMQAKGFAINESSGLMELKTNQFDRVNFGLGGYTGVTRELNRNMDISLRMSWSHDINNMFNNNVLKQRFTGYGVGFSVRYKLY